MKLCPAQNCSEPISDGLIFCGRCWGRLDHHFKKELVYLHPGVAARRTTKPRPGAYDQLLSDAVRYLSR